MTLSPVAVAGLIRRKMRHANGFVANERGADPSGIIGWYNNPAPWSDVSIVFLADGMTVRGGHLDGSEERYVAFADIIDFQLPEAPAATGVRLITRHGMLFVRVGGRLAMEGGERDAFCLARVLQAYLLATRPEKAKDASKATRRKPA